MEKDATEQHLTKAKTNKGRQRLQTPPPPLFSNVATGSDARIKRQGVLPPEVWTATIKKFGVLQVPQLVTGQRQGISYVVFTVNNIYGELRTRYHPQFQLPILRTTVDPLSEEGIVKSINFRLYIWRMNVIGSGLIGVRSDENGVNQNRQLAFHTCTKYGYNICNRLTAILGVRASSTL
jgi:hypothetical protein